MFYDVSKNTSKDVIAPRIAKRRGICIHTTDGYDSLAYLQGGSINDGRRVSADYLITRTGIVYQITPAGYYAFHTGTARWLLQQDVDRTLNHSFVGIELEWKANAGQDITSYQYFGLAWLMRSLLSKFPIEFRNIVGHYQIALPVGRKQDPVTMNWQMLTAELINPSVEQQSYKVRGELS